VICHANMQRYCKLISSSTSCPYSAASGTAGSSPVFEFTGASWRRSGCGGGGWSCSCLSVGAASAEAAVAAYASGELYCCIFGCCAVCPCRYARACASTLSMSAVRAAISPACSCSGWAQSRSRSARVLHECSSGAGALAKQSGTAEEVEAEPLEPLSCCCSCESAAKLCRSDSTSTGRKIGQALVGGGEKAEADGAATAAEVTACAAEAVLAEPRAPVAGVRLVNERFVWELDGGLRADVATVAAAASLEAAAGVAESRNLVPVAGLTQAELAGVLSAAAAELTPARCFGFAAELARTGCCSPGSSALEAAPAGVCIAEGARGAMLFGRLQRHTDATSHVS